MLFAVFAVRPFTFFNFALNLELATSPLTHSQKIEAISELEHFRHTLVHRGDANGLTDEFLRQFNR